MNLITCLLFMIMQVPSDTQLESNFIHLKKGACMGKCPVFELTVDTDRKLTFKGIRFTEMDGTHQRILTKKEFRKIKCMFKKSKLKKLDDEYGMNVMDASATTLTVNHKNFNKTIVSKIGVPEKLQKAEDYLMSLSPQSASGNYRWETIEKAKSTEVSGRKELSAPEIIVQFKNEISIDEWLKKYEKFGLKLNKKLIPNKPIYLLRHDPKTIQIDLLIKTLKADSTVLNAETNKKVEMR